MEAVKEQPKKGKVVLFSLLAFFAVFASVDAYFVYKAVITHTGVITENAYEKGLAYNQVIEQAKKQENMNVIVSFEEGILAINLKDEQGNPIVGAIVVADIVRNIGKSQDFEVVLHHKGNGLYQKPLELPLKGNWTAYIHATWTQEQQKHYQTALTINNQ